MKKIISCLALVVLSVAGFSALAKEVNLESQKTLAQVEAKAAELAVGIEKVQKQLIELDAQKNERMKVEIERDRKGIEFWFSLLGVLVGALTLIFGLIPVIFTYFQSKRTEKELEEAKELVRLIKKEHSVALSDAAEIKKLKDFSSQKEATAEDKLEIAKKVKAINDNPNASQIDKLRARAVQASQHEKPTREQAEFAFDLWKAIAVENPQDNNALLDAAYWAGITAELSEPVNKIHWLHQAQKLNEQTLKINPKEHVAACNWGVVLGKEAEEIAKTDLSAALILWQLAGEKFALALKINPENRNAANNSGIALGKEAIEVAKTDLKAAQTLWQQAGEKYALALKINPEKHEAANHWGNDLSKEAAEVAKTDLKAAKALWQQAVSLLEKHTVTAPEAVAYNLACFYSRLERFNESLTQLEIARLHKGLHSHWLEDDDLENLRQTDEFKNWYKTHFGDDKT